MKKNAKREGFTLVELLIVIVVIGVLSAMMMLSSTEAVSSAKAADIVSDLRNMKTAALAWYADHLDYVEGRAKKNTSTEFKTKGIEDERADILKYMNNESADAKYKFVGKNPGTWFVYYDAPDAKVAEKLKGRAKSVGLYKAAASDDANSFANAAAGTDKVYMFIR